MSDQIQLARQPILDSNLTLRGYELLARDGAGVFPKHVSGDASTSHVLINALAEFGLENVVGGTPAYINITREFVIGDLPLPPAKVVLELLETIEPDDEVMKGIANLRDKGFRLAVDDYTGPRAGYAELLSAVDIIKVDCFGKTLKEVSEILKGLGDVHARLLAEKVETHQEFRAYRELGFHLFQGYFYAQPDLLKSRTTSANRANLMSLLASLQNPDITPEELEGIIVRDPALSLKLVRFLNSVHIGLRRRIESLREVVVYLGSDTVRNLACLLMLSGVDNKPRQLMVTAMMRARMCEELAKATKAALPARAFTVGLFSTLDAVMDRSLPEVLADLPLSEDIAEALLRRRGALGTQLEIVLALERGDWSRIPLNAPQLQPAYLAALEWVAAMEDELAGAA